MIPPKNMKSEKKYWKSMRENLISIREEDLQKISKNSQKHFLMPTKT